MFVPQGVEELREAEGKERKTNWPCAVISRNKSTTLGGKYTVFSFPMIIRILPHMCNEHCNKICYRIRIIVITINVLFSVGYMH